MHWASFSFLHILKYFLLEKKKKKKESYIVGFQLLFFKTQWFLFCFNKLKMCFFFPSPISPPPGWLVGWSIFMFLNFSSMALSLYSLLKGMLSVTSCSSYGSLSKHLIWGSLEGHLLLIGLIWKRRTKTIWMSLQWNLSVKNFYVLLYHYSYVWFCTV